VISPVNIGPIWALKKLSLKNSWLAIQPTPKFD
jgi:hypothetical protein